MTTPWERAQALRKRSARTDGQRGEDRFNRLPGARAQVNSGRTHFSHRDSRLNGFLVEVRVTRSKTYSIDAEEFLDIQREALLTPPGLLAGIAVHFLEHDLKGIFIREEDWLYMKQRLDKVDDGAE